MSLAWIVGIITAAAYTAYLMTNILPLIFPQCPYRTLLRDLDHATYSYTLPYLVRCFWHTLFCASHSQAFSKSEWKDLKAMELEAVQSISGDLPLTVLHRLFSMSSNPRSKVSRYGLRLLLDWTCHRRAVRNDFSQRRAST